MKRFWNFIRDENGGRILRLEGPIDEENFWGDEVTPRAFRDELEAEDGDVTVYINSPGGNVFAAAEIYTMLIEHKGKVTVKIDAIAASAASVIAMAGDTVLMSPVAMLMLHDPMTVAMGNTKDMEKAIATLNEVKESIINAYHAKSGLNRKKISQIMEDETWLNAKKAVELGFADGIIERREPKEDEGESDDGKEIEAVWKPYSTRVMGQKVLNRIVSSIEKPAIADEESVEAGGDQADVEQAGTEMIAEEAVADNVTAESSEVSDADAAISAVKDKPEKPDPKKEPDEDNPDEGEESGDEPDGDKPDGEEPNKDKPDEESEDDPDEESEDDPGTDDDPPKKPKPAKAEADNMSVADTAEAKPPEMLMIGMDGKAKDGSMPYELLKKQLELMR